MNSYVIDSSLSREEIMKRLNATKEQVLTVGSECAASVWTAEDIASNLDFKKHYYSYLGIDKLFKEADIKAEEFVNDRYLLEDALENLHDFINSDDRLCETIRKLIDTCITDALIRRVREKEAEVTELLYDLIWRGL
ncbi:MAG TPA: hypothetical protein DCR21_06365 [Succinivibrionaceae bacterium]|nr:hypothetical protein [Succinivibrionaceae bacterium]